MNENYKQSLTLHAAASDIVHALAQLANLPQTVIATGDEAREAINHLITVLGLRSIHLDYLELEMRCMSAKVESGAVTFKVIGETTEPPGSHAAGWKGCAESFNKAIRALHEALTMKSGAA